MTGKLTEGIEKKTIEPQSNGGRFAESLKEDANAGKDFADSLRDDTGAGKDFAESLEKHSDNNENALDRRLPRTGGEWAGEPGDSIWKPDRDKAPENPQTNPDGQTWGEILDEYGIDSIPFKNGEPDFSEISKGTVEIDDFSDDRDDNFDAADEKLAEERGCAKEEVRQWRKEHGYTWHECGDMKTMQKVPTEVHGNIPHDGGISAKKHEEKSNG